MVRVQVPLSKKKFAFQCLACDSSMNLPKHRNKTRRTHSDGHVFSGCNSGCDINMQKNNCL